MLFLDFSLVLSWKTPNAFVTASENPKQIKELQRLEQITQRKVIWMASTKGRLPRRTCEVCGRRFRITRAAEKRYGKGRYPKRDKIRDAWVCPACATNPDYEGTTQFTFLCASMQK